MKKKLIANHNVTEFIDGANNTIWIAPDMILSPGARDVLRNKGVVIKYGCPDDAARPQTVKEQVDPIKPGCQADTELIARVATIIRDDFKITSEQDVGDICLQVMKKLTTT